MSLEPPDSTLTPGGAGLEQRRGGARAMEGGASLLGPPAPRLGSGARGAAPPGCGGEAAARLERRR